VRVTLRTESRSKDEVAVLRAVKKMRFVQRMNHLRCKFREWELVRDPVEVGIQVLSLRKLRLVDGIHPRHGALHELDQVRDSSEE